MRKTPSWFPERWYDEGKARFGRSIHRSRRKSGLPTTRVRRSCVRLYNRLGERMRNCPVGPFIIAFLLALPLAAQPVLAVTIPVRF